MVRNIQRARQNWARLNRVLIMEGADDQTLGQIYLAMVQLVLLYGSATQVLTLHMQRVLGISHHRVAHIMTGWQPQKGQGGGWLYPPL